MSFKKGFYHHGFIFAGWFVLAIGLLASVEYWKNPELREHADKLLIDAIGVVAMTVISTLFAVYLVTFWYEKRKEQQSIVADSVFTPELSRTLVDHIFQASHVRREDLRLRISLSNSRDENGNIDDQHIEFTNRIEYKLKNLSSVSRKVNITHSLDRIVNIGDCHFTEFAFKKGHDNDFTHISDIDNCVQFIEQAAVFNYTPEKIKPGESLSVQVTSKKIVRKIDLFVFNTYIYTKGFECRVVVDASLPIDVYGELLTVNGKSWEKDNAMANSYEWVAKDLILLPYQGIELRWYPKKSGH